MLTEVLEFKGNSFIVDGKLLAIESCHKLERSSIREFYYEIENTDIESSSQSKPHIINGIHFLLDVKHVLVHLWKEELEYYHYDTNSVSRIINIFYTNQFNIYQNLSAIYSINFHSFFYNITIISMSLF